MGVVWSVVCVKMVWPHLVPKKFFLEVGMSLLNGAKQQVLAALHSFKCYKGESAAQL